MQELEFNFRGELLFTARIAVSGHASQKNSKKISTRPGFRPVLYTTKDHKLRRDFFVLYLRQEMRKFKTEFPIKKPICAVLKFGVLDFYTKKNEINLKSIDIDNLLGMPFDALQIAGIILNDAYIIGHAAIRQPAQENFVEISLYEASM